MTTSPAMFGYRNIPSTTQAVRYCHHCHLPATHLTSHPQWPHHHPPSSSPSCAPFAPPKLSKPAQQPAQRSAHSALQYALPTPRLAVQKTTRADRTRIPNTLSTRTTALLKTCRPRTATPPGSMLHPHPPYTQRQNTNSNHSDRAQDTGGAATQQKDPKNKEAQKTKDDFPERPDNIGMQDERGGKGH